MPAPSMPITRLVPRGRVRRSFAESHKSGLTLPAPGRMVEE
jgi:hypothetical protein